MTATSPAGPEGEGGHRTVLLVYNLRDRALRQDLPLDDIDQLLKEPDNILWLDITRPGPDDFACLKREFDFHPLAMEDVTKAHQRPKLEHYESCVFMVAYDTRFDAAARCFDSQELALFIGKNYLVSVHADPLPDLDIARERWLEREELMSEGAGFLAYAILDTVVDGYFPALEAISDELEDLEAMIFSGPKGTQRSLPIVFRLKKELLHFRRLVVPLRDALSTLARWDSPIFGRHTVTYFRDVYDHLLRASDAIDTFRDLLNSVIELHMSVVSTRLNQVMKTMTVISTVLMSAALIAGIYGMNFKVMPELGWPNGYYAALGMMAAVSIVLVGLFKWRKYI